MRSTAIIGVGMTPVAEHWGLSLRELAAEAGQKALADAGITQPDAIYVANAYGSTFNFQTHLGTLVADYLGLDGVEAVSIEAADASGGAAIRQAHLAVASGAVESALVIGVEKATDMVGSDRVRARAVSLDADYESAHGATLTALAALLMRRYMHDYGVELSAFEGFSLNAHSNGQKNELAMYRNVLRAGSFAKAPMIADPVSLFDSAPDGDGAAAVVIVPADHASDMHPQPVRISGSGAATDTLMIQDRADITWLKAVEQSTARALQQAGRTIADMDALELHDAYTILTVLSLEALGLAERGKGHSIASEIGLQGKYPISTFGGLKSRGNPAGASGVYQVVEACLQLRQSAGANQVANAQTILTQSMGGLGATVITHILQTL
jgi:acetyl-CoA C-acetyltransferase